MRQSSHSGSMTSISWLRRPVLCLQTTRGCPVLQPTTGMSGFKLVQVGIPQGSSQGHVLWLSSCESDSSWTEIPEASGTDSNVSCKKEVQASLSRQLVDAHNFKFCLTNSLGSWCETLHVFQSQLPSAGRRMDFIYIRKRKKT